MKVYKTYKDKEDWFETTIDEMIERVEGSGAYAKGTSVNILKEIGTIQTPFAIWKLTIS